MTFSVGQRVWVRGGQRGGVVLEIDGSRIYIEQDNGAEGEYRATDLTADPPGQPSGPSSGPSSAHPAARPASASAATAVPRAAAGAPPAEGAAPPPRLLSAREITAEHARVLAIVPVRTVQAVAVLYERRPGAGRFSALDTASKLNVITEITTIPYRMMLKYSDRPGELGLLMGKGLADSQRAG